MDSLLQMNEFPSVLREAISPAKLQRVSKNPNALTNIRKALDLYHSYVPLQEQFKQALAGSEHEHILIPNISKENALRIAHSLAAVTYAKRGYVCVSLDKRTKEYRKNPSNLVHLVKVSKEDWWSYNRWLREHRMSERCDIILGTDIALL